MPGKDRPTLLALGPLSALLLSAPLAAPLAADRAETAPQLANPAAVFCVESGGSFEIRDSAAGQVGICILPDGREVDSWDYFREQHPQTGDDQ